MRKKEEKVQPMKRLRADIFVTNPHLSICFSIDFQRERKGVRQRETHMRETQGLVASGTHPIRGMQEAAGDRVCN